MSTTLQAIVYFLEACGPQHPLWKRFSAEERQTLRSFCHRQLFTRRQPSVRPTRSQGPLFQPFPPEWATDLAEPTQLIHDLLLSILAEQPRQHDEAPVDISIEHPRSSRADPDPLTDDPLTPLASSLVSPGDDTPEPATAFQPTSRLIAVGRVGGFFRSAFQLAESSSSDELAGDGGAPHLTSLSSSLELAIGGDLLPSEETTPSGVDAVPSFELSPAGIVEEGAAAPSVAVVSSAIDDVVKDLTLLPLTPRPHVTFSGRPPELKSKVPLSPSCYPIPPLSSSSSSPVAEGTPLCHRREKGYLGVMAQREGPGPGRWRVFDVEGPSEDGLHPTESVEIQGGDDSIEEGDSDNLADVLRLLAKKKVTLRDLRALLEPEASAQANKSKAPERPYDLTTDVTSGQPDDEGESAPPPVVGTTSGPRRERAAAGKHVSDRRIPSSAASDESTPDERKRGDRRGSRRHSSSPSSSSSSPQSESSDASTRRRREKKQRRRHGHRRRKSMSSSDDSDSSVDKSGMRFRPDDIGFFWPDADETDDIFYKGHHHFYKDVHLFVDALNDYATMGYRRHIRENMVLMLRGEALEWYRAQLSKDVIKQCKAGPSLRKWTKTLTARFQMDVSRAQRELESLRYDAVACRRGDRVRTFAMRIMRLAKSCGFSTDLAMLSQVWNRLDPRLRLEVTKPDKRVKLHRWLDELDDKALIWREQITAPRLSKPDNRGRDGSRGDGRPWMPPRNRPTWNRDLPHRERNADKPQDFIKPQVDTRQMDTLMVSKKWRPPEGNRVQFKRYERRVEHANLAQDDEDKLLIPVDDEDTLRHYDQDPDYDLVDDAVEMDRDELTQFGESDAAFLTRPAMDVIPVYPPKPQCRLCQLSFDSNNALQRHLRQPGECAGVVPNPDRSRCRTCQTQFTTRQALFDHLGSAKRCPHGSPPSMEDDVVILAQPLLEGMGLHDFAAYSYTSFDVYAQPNLAAMATRAIADAGCSTPIADENWIAKWPEVKYENVAPTPVRGLNGVVTLTRRATFTIYLRGQTPSDGKRKWASASVQAWVTRDLGPSLLLGTRWLHPHGVKLDFRHETMTVASCQSLVIPVQIHHRASTRLRRKVVSTAAVFVPPRATVKIPIADTKLPLDRAFAFTPERNGVLHALVNAETSFVVLANQSDVPVQINRNTRLGTITEYEYDTAHAYHVSVDRALLEAAMAPDFVMTEDMHENYRQTAARQRVPPPRDALSRDDDVPVRVVPEHAPGPPLTTPIDGPVRPRPVSHPSLGIRPVVTKEVVTHEGVHIAATDIEAARRLRTIVAAYDIWRDRGTLPVPIDEQMTVPLVNNWQSAKLHAKPYPLGLKDRKVVENTFDPLHKSGRMQWAQRPTPFAAPVFVVWKKVNGVDKGRVVIDLRNLNAVTIPDAYPLPRQEELIASLKGAKYISVVDARSFFYQFLVHPQHRDKLTLVTHRGLETPNVVLMGFRNSPPYVQRWIDRKLFPFRHFARAYIDDIVIFSSTLDEHCAHLHQLFSLFDDEGLCLSPEKSFLGYDSVILLGHQVDGEGSSLTDARVMALRRWSFPHSLRQLERYCAATNWIRNYIPLYAQKVAPLLARKTSLLAEGARQGQLSPATRRKGFVAKTRIDDDPVEKAAFQLLQDNLLHCLTLKLVHYDNERQLFVKIDASKERGFGAVLFHYRGTFCDDRPMETLERSLIDYIGFWSKLLSPAERNYWPTELELACLVWIAVKNKPLFHDAKLPVVILTDHAALGPIVRQRSLSTSDVVKMNTRIVNASIFLSQYQLKVLHIPGKLNVLPDALSRLSCVDDDDDAPRVASDDTLQEIPTPFETAFLSAEIAIQPDVRRQFVDGYEQDSKYKHIIQQICASPSIDGDGTRSRRGLAFELRSDGILLHVARDGTRRLCVPHQMVKMVIELAHDPQHFGETRTRHELSCFTFPKMWWRIKTFIRHCSCEQFRQSRQPELGDLQPITPPVIPYKTQCLDFISALPVVASAHSMFQQPGYDEFDCVLNVTCKASKKRGILPGHSTYPAELWARVVVSFWLVADWGLPSAMISDRDQRWMSAFWNELFRLLNTRLIMTTAWHSAGDGQAESTNAIVEAAIRYYFSVEPNGYWPSALPAIQSSLNNAHVEAIQCSPNELVMGFRPQTPLTLLRDALAPSLADDQPSLEFLRTLRQHEAQLATDFANARYKRRFDSRHRQHQFSVGDPVFLRLHHGYKLPGQSRKFGQQKVGPLTIRRKISPHAFELDLPPHWRIHPVISIAQLEPAPIGDDPFARVRRNSVEALHLEGDDDEWQSYEIETLLAKRVFRGRPQYLVRWAGWDAEYDEWYDEDLLQINANELLRQFNSQHLIQRQGIWRPRAHRGG